MKSYDAISVIAGALKDELIVSANGFISRQLYTIKDRPQNFYMLGSMGLASSIGVGLAFSVPDSKIVIIDGDGNILMNLGSLATIGNLCPKNLVHIVLDNESYDSTGGQPTVSNTAKLEKMAEAAGYKTVKKVSDIGSLQRVITQIRELEGPVFLLVKIEGGIEKTSRVMIAPEGVKERFVSAIKST